MNELGVWRLLLLVGMLALTSPARALGDVQVTFSESGPHWCWLRSAAGPVTAGPVEAAGNTLTLSAPVGPGDTVMALDPRTGRTAARALTTLPDGSPRPVQFLAADFRDPPSPALVPALAGLSGVLAGLSAALAGLLLWQARRRHPAAALDPVPVSAEPEEDCEPSASTARGPSLPLSATTTAATLIGVQGLVAGGMFALSTGDVLVGRDGDNDIVLAENLVSRRHARLRRDTQGRFVLTDLGSANGVHVNGMRVARAYLASGDEIKIGDNFFRFHIEDRTEIKTTDSRTQEKPQ